MNVFMKRLRMAEFRGSKAVSSWWCAHITSSEGPCVIGIVMRLGGPQVNKRGEGPR